MTQIVNPEQLLDSYPAGIPRYSICRRGPRQPATLLSTVTKTPESRIRAIYLILRQLWGVQHWWPAESPFEVAVGAFLTQNTAWTNVEKALKALREAGLLSVEGIRKVPLPELEKLIRPSGYFRQKATRLKAFVDWLDQHHQGDMESLFRQPTDELRRELLALNGVGRETADTILLYAAVHEIFVVDAYTRRILERHELVMPSATYDEIRLMTERALASVSDQSPSGRLTVSVKLPTAHVPSAMSQLPRTEQAQRFNEFHALLVQVGKHYCHRKRALCEQCPLAHDLPGVAASPAK